MAVDVAQLVASIDSALQAAGTPERAEHEQAYLKSTLVHYGASVPAIRKVARSTRRGHPTVTHDELVELVAGLWAKPVHECRMVSVELLDAFNPWLTLDDAPLLERLLRESRTWALVDNLSGVVVGKLVERDGAFNTVLDRWAIDDDFWIRRSALLALLVPLRRGGGDFDRFGRYADAMLDEREFFIRKAIGWVLRDMARKRPDLVFEWSLPRAARMSGVTFREVVKPLSADQRASLLDARAAA